LPVSLERLPRVCCGAAGVLARGTGESSRLVTAVLGIALRRLVRGAVAGASDVMAVEREEGAGGGGSED
jgi:hypothetical protein